MGGDFVTVPHFDSTLNPMDAAHICIARHGETDWNRRGVLQGWLDVPINAQGRH